MGLADINRKVQFFDLAAQRERQQSPKMAQETKAVRHPTLTKIDIRIFAVQSPATGDGVYNCFEQTLVSAEWDDTAGDPKFEDKDETNVEVLNLAEFDPEAMYVAHLAAGDLIVAWQKTDDEDNKRWAGVPLREGAHGGGVRLAYCSEDAGDDNTIAATLDHTTGTAIPVTCHICNGTALNAAIPRLADNDEIFVTKIGGTWYCTTIFQASENCDCYTEP